MEKIGPDMIGKVYNVPPMPPDAATTRWLDAGVLRIGVEYREVDPAALAATYASNAAYMAEIDEKSPAGGFFDSGVSLHVSGADDGHEYLRFDVFDGEPHYHYVHRTGPGEPPVNNVIDFDVTAHGEMLPWALAALRTRIGAMLAQAGGGHLVAGIDHGRLDAVLTEAGEMAATAQAAQRQLRAAPAAPA